MDTIAVARALENLADLQELSGVAVFKVRAFRSAARALEGSNVNIAELAREGKLTSIRGVGEGVARRILELIETGTIAESEALAAKLPPGLSELMNVPGLGLKTAQQVFHERKITSIDELEAAAKAGRLKDLPRFGEKREQKLLLAIEAYRKRAAAPKRRPMAEALLVAEALVARLRGIPGVVACEFAGSLRRRTETVGDLDILVAASMRDAPAIIDAFTGAADVVEVLVRGETKASVVGASGLQADLRIVPPDAWGAALQYFTGSKDHNVAMRTLAVKKGLKVSEYGVFDEAGNPVAGRDEASVYEAIGLCFIEPELRENRGEIEAAVAGNLPVLVCLRDLRGDLHMHTTATDGKSTLEEMVESGIAAGHSYLAITEHSETLTFVRGMTRERLREQRKEIRNLEEKLGVIRIFAGIETDILADGTLDLDDVLTELDWVVGSVHQHQRMPKDEMTKRVVRAIESGKMDCLGHPTGRQIGYRDPSAIDIEVVLQALKRTGVAIELNGSPTRLDVDEHMARMARDAGVLVVLNSDAHGIREMSNLRYGIGIARRAWLSKAHVLNTRNATEIEAWRHARRT